uniref:Microtubule associated scaffold protein 1 n=2 Tax=Galliformes TaxID=8976 RepID=A0A8C9EQM1_PAVCR
MGCASSRLCLYPQCAAARREEALKQHKELSQELVNLRGEL